MDDDVKNLLGVLIAMSFIFVLGLFLGCVIDESIKSDYLARTLYKNTEAYVQHKQDNFYHLLKLVEIKEQ